MRQPRNQSIPSPDMEGVSQPVPGQLRMGDKKQRQILRRHEERRRAGRERRKDQLMSGVEKPARGSTLDSGAIVYLPFGGSDKVR